MFQGPQRPLDEGPLDFDIVLGQLDRRVRDMFYTACRRMRVITDVHSPRKVRFATVDRVAMCPPCECLAYAGSGCRLGFIASARRVQDLPAALLRKSLPRSLRDLARGHAHMATSGSRAVVGTCARSAR